MGQGPGVGFWRLVWIPLIWTKQRRKDWRFPNLHCTDFFGRLENISLDLPVDYLSRFDKSLKGAKFSKRCDDILADLFDMVCCLRWCFHEHQSVFTSECFALLFLHCTLTKNVTSNERNTFSSGTKARRSYDLFPISMITISDLESRRSSSNQLVTWLKVWRLIRRRTSDKQIFVFRHITGWCHRREGHTLHRDSTIEWSNGRFLHPPSRPRRRGSKEWSENNWRYPRFAVWFVSHQRWSAGSRILHLRPAKELVAWWEVFDLTNG